MNITFDKTTGLLPVIIQDEISLRVLMLGFMNEEAYSKTVSEQKVTFFSRSKKRLWTKGESSGNFLHVKNMHLDCDSDALLIQVSADGPTCHTGSVSCFDSIGFLYKLEQTICHRIENDIADSYTNKLYRKGINKVAQKVGEEAIELIIEAKDENANLFKNEAADLLFHFLILLKSKGFSLSDVEKILKGRYSSCNG